MKCDACGFENAPGARFCGSCGRALERRCPSCGEAVDPGLAFCTSCGAALETAAAAGSAREERKVVTVLFCDLVGFTTRAEQLDPEDVRAMLSPFYARLRPELERFGGTVEKFIGDAVMALFGAPVAHEDDPERAVRAALAIRERSRPERGGPRAAGADRRQHGRGAGRRSARDPRRARGWPRATSSTRPRGCSRRRR